MLVFFIVLEVKQSVKISGDSIMQKTMAERDIPIIREVSRLHRANDGMKWLPNW